MASSKTEVPAAKESPLTNPVGKLQELAQRRLWPMPVYTFEPAAAPADTDKAAAGLQFLCTVRLRSSVGRGRGRSKRLAKREAAAWLLPRLLATPRTPSASPSRGGSPPPSPSRVSPLSDADFQRLRGSKRLQSAAKAGTEVGGLFQGVRNRKAGESIPPVDANGRGTATEQLQDLARAHKFRLQFLHEGPAVAADCCCRRLCVVKLSTMPTIVAVGNGADAAGSRERACRAALDYLALMTKEAPAAASPAGKKG